MLLCSNQTFVRASYLVKIPWEESVRCTRVDGIHAEGQDAPVLVTFPSHLRDHVD